MKAMILAAGRGERMRPLTDHIPKPLLPVAGRRLIEYHIARLVDNGFDELVINCGWLGSQIPEALGNGERYGCRIQYSMEPENALETGGGIFQALPLLGSGLFLVINGDVWTDFDLGRMNREPEGVAHLVLVPNPPHNPKGDFVLTGDRVLSEGEGDRYTFSGIGIYRPEVFAGCEPGRFPLAPLLRRAMNANKVTGELHTGRWWDIGTPERLQMLEDALSA